MRNDFDFYDYADMVEPPPSHKGLIAILALLVALGVGTAIFMYHQPVGPTVPAPIIEPSPEPTPEPCPRCMDRSPRWPWKPIEPTKPPTPAEKRWVCNPEKRTAEAFHLAAVLAEPNDEWDPLFGGPEWRMEAAECAARRWREEGF